MRALAIPVILSLVGSALPAQGAAASDDTTSRPVVMFSTDYGLGVINGATNGPDRHAADVDDAYAVSQALHATEVQAIVTTFGNDKARPSAESTRRGVTALGLPGATDIVVVGSEGFLDAAPVTLVPSAGSGDHPIFCVNAGVRRMRDVLTTNAAGSVTLFAIGPFTDIACLQRAFPDEYARLGEIIGLVGSSDGMPAIDGIEVVDFNFAMDPSALGEVIAGDQGVPITFITFDVSSQGTLPNAVIDAWAQSDDDVQRYYGLATQPHAAYWDAIFSDTDGQALFDAHTVHYFLRPDAYACEDEMLATATVGGYPDTSASTTRNSLTVVSNGGTTPARGSTSDGSTYTYTGPVRGCSGFTTPGGLAEFEGAVMDSISAIER